MQSFSSALFNTFFIILFIWIVVLITALISLSRRKDVLAPVKVFWAAVIVFAPLAGLLVFLIYGPKKRV